MRTWASLICSALARRSWWAASSNASSKASSSCKRLSVSAATTVSMTDACADKSTGAKNNPWASKGMFAAVMRTQQQGLAIQVSLEHGTPTYSFAFARQKLGERVVNGLVDELVLDVRLNHEVPRLAHVLDHVVNT